ncbi:ABC transporter permease [Thermotoga profunda]|uniref:ABC transporter permease n=1 Tax=Thermotoga profunda TaxID=1508420 RepID=UPI000596BFF7|nr:ABC transporter permease [Thermotoga profunda]
MTDLLNPEFWYSVIRVSTPLFFGVMASLLSSITGTINIGIEGMMLMSAFWGTIIASFTQNSWIGLLAGVASSTLLAILLAYFHLKLKTDLVIGGVAINLLSSGLTVFLLYAITGDKGSSASLRSFTIPKIDIPFLKDIPFIGKVLSGHNTLTYIAILSIFVVNYLVKKTPLGIRMRSVGENPDAAVSVGISVNKMKSLSLVLSGIFAGFGGAFLSMGYVSWFARDMTSGRGFISIAAQALGGNSALFGAFGALIFGVAEALGITLQSLRIPSEITNMLPFILTIVVLIIYARSKIRSHSRIQEQ